MTSYEEELLMLQKSKFALLESQMKLEHDTRMAVLELEKKYWNIKVEETQTKAVAAKLDLDKLDSNKSTNQAD